MDLTALLSLYCLHRPQLEKTTIDCYGYAVGAFGRFLGRPARVADLSEQMLLSFISGRLGQGAEWTARRELGTLSLLWRFAWRRKLIESDPRDAELPSIRLHQDPPIALTIEQFLSVLRSCEQESGKIRGTAIAKSTWWRSLLTSLYYSGARVTAMLSAKKTDLDQETGWLLLRGRTAKTDRGQFVQLPRDAVALVAELRWFGDTIWPQPYDRRWLWTALRRIVVRAGLPGDRRYRFHAIRRTTASHMAARTSIADAQQLLGHTTAAQTRKYLDPRIMTIDIAASLPAIG